MFGGLANEPAEGYFLRIVGHQWQNYYLVMQLNIHCKIIFLLGFNELPNIVEEFSWKCDGLAIITKITIMHFQLEGKVVHYDFA